MDFVQQMW